MMHVALEPYYGGDHRAHARRIVETATSGNTDENGHFSSAQRMYIAEEDGQVVGILNFVVKYQGTLKISPLIVHERVRGRGVSTLLLQKLLAYAQENRVRQIYCTVAEKNHIALGYFFAHGFIPAGIARSHYRPGMNEVMLYKIMEYDTLYTIEGTISVVPLAEADKVQVRRLVIRRLSPYFEGVNDRWVDALFSGYERSHLRDPNKKYKLIWVAKALDGTVLGVAAATPKKVSLLN